MTEISEIPIINTKLFTTMELVFDQVATGAGLAILRGPAGIGKTYALLSLEEGMHADGVHVISVTVTPAIGGSLSAFVRHILSLYRIEATSTPEGVESLYNVLRGYPFRSYGPRVLLLIDEAQELKTVILEMIRGLWDRGDQARLGAASVPAFGCVLVGNNTFMNRNGGVSAAYFRPLLSRVTHSVDLPRPSKDEHEAFAAALFEGDAGLQGLVCSFGEDQGSFRAQAVAARQARLMAAKDKAQVAESHLRMAIRMMGGK